MLGGYPDVSRVDLQGSRNFLAKLGVGGGANGAVGTRRRRLRSGEGVAEGEGEGEGGEDGRVKRAVDCGAG